MRTKHHFAASARSGPASPQHRPAPAESGLVARKHCARSSLSMWTFKPSAAKPWPTQTTGRNSGLPLGGIGHAKNQEAATRATDIKRQPYACRKRAIHRANSAARHHTVRSLRQISSAIGCRTKLPPFRACHRCRSWQKPPGLLHACRPRKGPTAGQHEGRGCGASR